MDDPLVMSANAHAKIFDVTARISGKARCRRPSTLANPEVEARGLWQGPVSVAVDRRREVRGPGKGLDIARSTG